MSYRIMSYVTISELTAIKILYTQMYKYIQIHDFLCLLL